MAKISKDEAKAAVKTAKEGYKAARGEQRAFEKEHSLEKDVDHSGNEKQGKRWTKLSDRTKAAQEKVDKAEKALEEVKASGGSRRTTYDYPADVKTAADRKKFRTQQRAIKKKKEKGDEPKKEKKVEKVEGEKKKVKKEKTEKSED